MKSKKKIFLAGHKGLVGSSIYRLLKKNRKYRIIVKDKDKLNLLDQRKTYEFLKKNKFDYVIIAAARVGGINANNIYSAKFLFENLQIQNNLIHGSYLSKIKNLIFLGSSCIYPNNFSRPIKESDLLVSNIEKTNEAYALAKIAGLKMCNYYSKNFNVNYKTLMPCNLFGPNDNYDLSSSHFLPALIAKVYKAKTYKKKNITIWGNGKPLREVMFVDELAYACLFFLDKKIKGGCVNIASGFEKSILDYAKIIMKYFSVNLKINFDKSKPNGTLRKKLNISFARKMGWKPKYSFLDGLDQTIKNYIKNVNNT
jgi:GDP-L-fucose synthase